jgi:hypothetical protein
MFIYIYIFTYKGTIDEEDCKQSSARQ